MIKEEGQIKEWWKSRKKKYNIALVIAGIIAFLTYCYVGGKYIPPPYFEVTIFSIFFQGIAYLICMAIANGLYTLAMNIDIFSSGYIKNDIIRKVIFYGYFIVSCLLPFTIPLLIYMNYHDGYLH